MPLPATGGREQGQLASCRKYEPKSSIGKTAGYPIRYTLSLQIAAPEGSWNKSMSAAGDPAQPQRFDVSRDYVGPLANFCSKRAQILPGGRCSRARANRHPMGEGQTARLPESVRKRYDFQRIPELVERGGRLESNCGRFSWKQIKIVIRAVDIEVGERHIDAPSELR